MPGMRAVQVKNANGPFELVEREHREGMERPAILRHEPDAARAKVAAVFCRLHHDVADLRPDAIVERNHLEHVRATGPLGQIRRCQIALHAVTPPDDP